MLGYQSEVVNGQLIYTPTVESYLPLSYAPVAPAQMWQGQDAATIPPQLQAAMAAVPTQTGSGNMPNSWTGTPATTAGWLHPTKYPITAAIVGLVLGLLVLRFIHWSG